MEEKPRVTVTRVRRTEAVSSGFNFTSEMIPAQGGLNDYRAHAWEVFNRLGMPSMTEEH